MLKREWNEIGPAKWKIPFHSTNENFGKSNRKFWSNGKRPQFNFERKHAVHRRHLEPSPATHASEDRRKIRNGMEFVPRVEISIFLH